MKTFEANKKYQMRFVTDSDLIVPITIIKRTAKQVVINIHGEEKRCKIKVYDNCEYILPEGQYSMAPRCRADREI